MKTMITMVTLMLSLGAYAAANLGAEAMKLVPESKVLQEKGREVKLQTSKGGIIEIEFDRKGALTEASGENVEMDVFNAPAPMLSLKDAVAAAQKAGKTPAGEWSLEKGTFTGWAYEFKGFENGKEMEYVIDAKSGELKKQSKD